ncbi:hypothetical protein [Pseudarthrobacter sp. PvP090]|uniref:hypothetical protein n=1 Tax=Pseudarthrobacter sp. PvP090 TaxID=3156393 RepID=UPI0033921CA6
MALTVFVVLGALAGWTVSKFTDPIYKSQSSVYFSLDSSQSATDLNQGATYTQNQMVSFAKLTTTPIVLDPVARDLSLDSSSRALAQSIEVSFPPDSVILQIVVADPSADQARDIANAVAQQLSVVAEQVGPKAGPGKGNISAQIIEQATAASSPVSPAVRVNVAAGAFLGLLLGLLLGLIGERVRSRVRSAGDIQAAVPNGVLAVVEASPASTPLMVAEPSGLSADQYRRAVMNLQQRHGAERPLSFVVAPASNQSASCQVAENLAVAFAEQDARVIIVDANPAPAATETGGLSDILEGAKLLEATVIPGIGGTYDRLPAGGMATNPHRQLASKALDGLLERLQSLYDVVLVETAPLDQAADGLQIARRLSGLVLTVENGTTRRRDVRTHLEEVQSAGVQLAGVVFCLRNRRPRNRGAHTSQTAAQPVSEPAGSAHWHGSGPEAARKPVLRSGGRRAN